MHVRGVFAHGWLTAGSLLQVAQRATDLDVSVAFYRDVLGGRFLAKFDPPGLAFGAIGGTRLLLDDDAPSCTLYFQMDDLTAACVRLKGQAIAIEHEPQLIHRDNAGQFGPAGAEEKMAFLRDPAGNLIGLVERRPG